MNHPTGTGHRRGGVVLGLVATASAMTACGTSIYAPAGETLQTITIGSSVREFLVHVPVLEQEPRAIVLVLHGGGGQGLGVANKGTHPLSVFTSVADREGFVVVYPAGSPDAGRQELPGWNDCRADNGASSQADDIGFLVALIGELGDRFDLPSSRIFMVGSSNGAQMTQAFAFHRPDLVGGVASAGGNQPVNPLPGPCTDGPTRPVPVLLMHGTSDSQMPYDGGCVANIGGACTRGRVVSALDTRDRWLDINGLSGLTPTETVIDSIRGDGGAAHRFVYNGAAPVEWWRLDGAGHTVASQSVPIAANRFTGRQNRDIEFAEIVWAFFERLLQTSRNA